MNKEHWYQVNVKWEDGRLGNLSSQVLNDDLTIATPPEFNQGIEGIWSPEHYFVAAVNGCLMTTFLAVAENFKLEFTHFESNADGKLSKVDGKFMMSEVILKPVVTIKREEDKALAEKVLIKSEKACLISNSIISEVKMEITIKVES